MSSGYEISLEPLAERDLTALPPAVQAGVARALLRLAEQPSRWATAGSAAPYPPGQLFRTSFPAGGTDVHLDVYQYGQDEKHLSVARIYVEYG